jgi:hypothetical protein
MKDNADYHVTRVLVDKTKKKNATGVLKEQYYSCCKAKQCCGAAFKIKAHHI